MALHRRADLPGEFMMNAFRLNNGVNARLFRERNGIPLSEIHQSVLACSAWRDVRFAERQRREGLLTAGDDLIRPTELSRRYLNRLIGVFL